MNVPTRLPKLHRLRWVFLASILGGFLAAAALPALCRATTRHVPGDYPTIQAAIDHSVNGDVVLIAPGTYQGTGNRDIQLHGLSIDVTSSAGAEQTIIDCQGAGRGFWLHEWEGPGTRIEKLTIENGRAPQDYVGGGIFCDTNAPTISECRLLNCRAYEGGGLALFLFGGMVDRCVISGNRAEDDGGGIVTRFNEGVSITNCVITGNSSDISIVGGVSFTDDLDGDALTGCTITGNAGGGVWTNHRATLTRCILWGNCSSGQGAELLAGQNGASFVCSDVDSSGVHAYNGPISYDPACVYTDPLFCGPVPCSQTTNGDWTLNANSRCLADHSPCHELIGALDEGCGSSLPTGACCLLDGSCAVLDRGHCEKDQGNYLGDNTTCTPNPCQPVPTKIMTWGQIKSAFR